LRPDVFGLIDLYGVIKEGGAAKDLFAGFRIDVIIQGQQQPAINGRFGNQ
jgi:hypothetical protein